VSENTQNQELHDRAVQIIGTTDYTPETYLTALSQAQEEGLADTPAFDAETRRSELEAQLIDVMAHWYLDQRGIGKPTDAQLTEAMIEAGGLIEASKPPAGPIPRPASPIQPIQPPARADS
jgi:hypothetical protein